MVKINSSEEENSEFLASIWNKYKYLFILGITLVVAGILGWESLSKSQASSEQIVSDLYESYIDIKDNKSNQDIFSVSEREEADFVYSFSRNNKYF